MQMEFILTFYLNCIIIVLYYIFANIGTYDGEGPLLVIDEETYDPKAMPQFLRPRLRHRIYARF